MLGILVWVLVSLIAYLLIEKPLLKRSLRWSALLQYRLSLVEMPVTAAELARRLIDGVGLRGLVTLGKAECDQYDSDTSQVCLADETSASSKIPDGLIAAHEVGHAVIDKSSRLLKLVCDLSAYAQTPEATKYIFAASVVSAILNWQAVLKLGLLSLTVQLVAATVILLVEKTATRYGTAMLAGSFDISRNLEEALKRCGHAALTTHARDLARPAALLLILSQLTAFSGSAMLLIPAAALAVYGYLFVTCWALYRQDFSKSRV